MLAGLRDESRMEVKQPELLQFSKQHLSCLVDPMVSYGFLDIEQ